MRKGFRTLFASLVIAVIVGIAWLVLRHPPDPIYKGKRLSVWLEAYDGTGSADLNEQQEEIRTQQETDDAVRHIGTNAFPMLLDMLQARDTKLKIWAKILMQELFSTKSSHSSAVIRNREAARAFHALGASASNAVPDLVKIYRPYYFPPSQRSIVYSLGYIGPPARSAIPFLLRLAADTNDYAWAQSLYALGEIHSESAMVVPMLTKLLHGPLPSARGVALIDLGKFGTDARPATSAILELLRDQNVYVRHHALHALSRIFVKSEWDPYEGLESQEPRKLKPQSESPSETIIHILNDLGAMGTNAAPAVPALIKFLADPDNDVRVSATNALNSIDPQAAAKAGVK
jgi:HEAT repeat protein